MGGDARPFEDDRWVGFLHRLRPHERLGKAAELSRKLCFLLGP